MAARDRFKDLGAGQVPMQEIGAEREGLLVPTADDRSGFFGQVESIDARIKVVQGNIKQIEQLQYASLAAVDQQVNQNAIRQLTEDTQQIIRQLRGELKASFEATQRLGNTYEAKERRTQELHLADQLKKVAEEYQRVQQTVEAQMKDRMARQFRIVRPGASEEEIQNAVNSGGDQVFSREILASRVGEQKRALEEVQLRHNQIQQIEKSVTELFTLMQDMQQLLDMQQIVVDQIEEHVEKADRDIEIGNIHIDGATGSAEGIRKKKLIIIGIVLTIVIIIAIIIGVQVSKNSSSNNSKLRRRAAAPMPTIPVDRSMFRTGGGMPPPTKNNDNKLHRRAAAPLAKIPVAIDPSMFRIGVEIPAPAPKPAQK
ncbi:Plasma membrane t-SNARE, secretory vesicle fusion [Borealophlyctis nickersoniae]|nr:Plasma membrane t-SNARE, secretory vesicle fusion [Borealophlyctis nickersoniae]